MFYGYEYYAGTTRIDILIKVVAFFDAVPVNPFKNENDPGEHLLEKISFHHQYNSRAKEIMQRRGRVSAVLYLVAAVLNMYRFNR